MSSENMPPKPVSDWWIEDELLIVYPQIEVTNFEVLDMGLPPGEPVEWLVELTIARRLIVKDLRISWDAKSGKMFIRHLTFGNCSLLQSRLGKRIMIALLLEYRIHLEFAESDRLRHLRRSQAK